MSANGDSEPHPGREAQIWARVTEIREELSALLRELRGGGDDEEDSPEKRRAAFRIIRGGLVLVLIGACLGMVRAPAWVGRHARGVGAAVATVGAAGIVAGALFAHGSPAPRSHAAVPPARASATASAHPGVPSHTPTTAPPTPERTRGIPTALPVLLPSRGRRPAPSASGAAPPSGPGPTPSRPAPSSTSPPPPPPFTCPAGLVLQIVGIGVYVCV